MADNHRLLELAKDGDRDARDKLVTDNMGLVVSVARRYVGRGQELEDLIQIGLIGLVKAIDRFDMDYEVKLSTYAVPLIQGEIRRFLRDDGMIKVSRSLKELAYRAYTCQDKLRKKWGRDPTLLELARALEVEPEELTAALEASSDVESLHKPIYQKDGHEIELMDKLEEKECREEELLNHIVLGELLKRLAGEERQLIYLRYFANKTQAEIGEVMGISQVQVSRMEKRILRNLREML